MKRNACQKCAFAVRDDNPHCGLRGFTTSFNVEWCSAENDKAPNGYELQEDGYFSWVKKEYPKTYEEFVELVKKMRKKQWNADMITGEESIGFIDMVHIEQREAEREVDEYLKKMEEEQ